MQYFLDISGFEVLFRYYQLGYTTCVDWCVRSLCMLICLASMLRYHVLKRGFHLCSLVISSYLCICAYKLLDVCPQQVIRNLSLRFALPYVVSVLTISFRPSLAICGFNYYILGCLSLRKSLSVVSKPIMITPCVFALCEWMSLSFRVNC